MRCFVIVAAFAGLTAAVGTAHAAPAAAAYCPNAAHAREAPVPKTLEAAVAAAFQLDIAAVHDAAYVRCVGPVLMGCYVGANLPCGKADTHRSLPGATAFCRDNPGATIVPMAATGHATIYEWSCQGRRAVPRKAETKLDAQGYFADNWKELR